MKVFVADHLDVDWGDFNSHEVLGVFVDVVEAIAACHTRKQAVGKAIKGQKREVVEYIDNCCEVVEFEVEGL